MTSDEALGQKDSPQGPNNDLAYGHLSHTPCISKGVFVDQRCGQPWQGSLIVQIEDGVVFVVLLGGEWRKLCLSRKEGPWPRFEYEQRQRSH